MATCHVALIACPWTVTETHPQAGMPGTAVSTRQVANTATRIVADFKTLKASVPSGTLPLLLTPLPYRSPDREGLILLSGCLHRTEARVVPRAPQRQMDIALMLHTPSALVR